MPPVTGGARAPRVGRGRHRIGLFALAFLLMATIAMASMVRFTGRQEPERRPAERPPSAPAPAIGPGGLVIPVAGVSPGAVTDSWGQARAAGAREHHGTDIMAAGGTPVLAAAAGTVEKLFDSRDGGHTLYVRSGDGRWSYYYAHLAAYAADVREGVRVRAGQHIGFVGDTGNAGPGNYHLHFGVARMAPGERWWAGAPVNPYPLLVGKGAAR